MMQIHRIVSPDDRTLDKKNFNLKFFHFIFFSTQANPLTGIRNISKLEKMAEIAALKDGNAWVELITGHMFSGKSTELIKRLNAFHAASILSGFKWKTGDPDQLRIMVIKSTKDTRDKDAIIKGHKGGHKDAFPFNNLSEALDTEQYALSQVIAVDEAHFFDGKPLDSKTGISTDLFDFVVQCIRDRKVLFVSALDGDFSGATFMHVAAIISKCNSITKHNTACKKCLSPACYSYNPEQKTRMQPGDEGDGYTCICHECWVNVYPHATQIKKDSQ